MQREIDVDLFGATHPCELRYQAGAELPEGLLYLPTAMEDKWVLAYRDGASFREELIADAASVETLLVAMRDGAPTLFLFFTATARVEDQRSRIGLAPAAGSGAALSDKERQAASLLAEWVVMMDATLATHRSAVAAARDGDPVSLASARLALEAGARSADQIRRLIVGLR